MKDLQTSRRISRSQETTSIAPPSRLFLLMLAGILLAIFLFSTFVRNHTLLSTKASHAYLFGTLETDATKATQEHAAGIQVAVQTIGWNDYEPQDGVFNEAYMEEVKSLIKMDIAAGMKIVISPAIHYPPTWVIRLPNARYVNQYGAVAPPSWAGHFEEPNFIFNQIVRNQLARFETHVMKQLADDPAIGLRNIWAVRYVNGSLGETLYPPTNGQGAATNSYWAFDVNAQGKGKDLPATIPASPFPGWKPGDTTYHHRPFSTAQVQQWYNWYLNAHIDFVNWHTKLYRDPHGINYQGYLFLLTPGFGARPFEVQSSIKNYLRSKADPNGTVARAAVWYKLFPALLERTNVVAYVSSMADGSGIPQNNACQRGDVEVNYERDPQVNNWSATRYIAGLADKYEMMISGENPGRGDPGQGGGATYNHSMMQTAASQMEACHLLGMFWAHDSDLYDSTSGVTLKEYASII